MAGSQTLRFDIVGDASSAARAFRSTADNAELAARGARHAADALELQRRSARASSDASLSLAKSDDILAEVEHRLRDGALEAEFALKRETAAKKASARASAEAEAADSRLSKVGKSLKGGFGGSWLGALPAALPAAGALLGPLAAVTASLGGAGLAAGAFGLLAKTSFSQVSAAASAYAKAQGKLAASPATAPAATAAQLASARASLAAAQAAEKNAKGHAAMTAAQLRVTAAQDRLNALETQGTKVSSQRAAALKAEKAALDGLTPAQRTMVTSLTGIQAQWKALAASVTTPALAAWLSAANDGLRFMKPLVEPVATVFRVWGETLDRYFRSRAGSAELTRIAAALGQFGATQMSNIIQFFVLAGKGVANLGKDLAGHNVDFGAFGTHLLLWGQAFEQWSSSARARKDVGAFLDWMRGNGRTVSDLLGSIAKVLPNLFSGLSSAGTLELQALTDFFGLAAKLPPWMQKWVAEGLPLFLVGSKVLPVIGAAAGLVGKVSALWKLPAPTWLGGAGKAAAAGEGTAAAGAGTAGSAGAAAAGKTLGGLIGKGLLAGLVAALDVGLNKVIDHELGKGSSAGQFAKAGGEVLSGAIIGGMLAGPFGAAAGAIVGLIIGVFTNPKVRHDIAGAFDLVRHDIAHVWDLTVRDTRIAWNDLYGATIGVAIRIGHNIETQWNSLRHGTASAFDHIRHDTASAMNDLYGATIGVAIRIGHNIETQFNSLRHSTANIFDGVRHDTAAAWDRIWADTGGKVAHGIGVTVAWFRRLPGEVLGALKGLGGSLYSFGKAILSDLWHGAADAFKTVGGGIVNWFKGVGSSILNAIKGIFHFGSPSKVTYRYGQWIVEGMHKGVESKLGGFLSNVKYKVGAGVEQWRGLVVKALAMEGLPTDLAPNVLYQMQTESGGNPNAINLCLTLDAMILTRRGWVKHDEVQAGDETIGYNFASGRNEWTRITAVHHYEDAPLVRIGNSRWHATVTPEHRWVNAPRMHVTTQEPDGPCHLCPWPENTRRRGKTTAGGLRIHLAKAHGVRGSVQQSANAEARFTATKDIRSRDRLLLSAEADTGPGLDITVPEAAILGWVAGDGHVEKYADRPRGRKRPTISIAQSKPAMVAKLNALLADVPHAHYTQQSSSRVHQLPGTGHQWRLDPEYAQDLMRRAGHPKDDAFRQVLEMSAVQRRAWLDAFIDAEGHRDGGYVSVTQAHGPVLEAAHLAIYLCGYRPRRIENARQDPAWSPTAHISAGRPVVAGGFLKKTDAGRGPVWCVTTELGSWTAEQDGQFFLTGNSDINAQRGDPSRGLMQVIGATFRAYHWPGTSNNIYDPLANIAAAINYADHVYGPNLANRYGGIGSGHGYAGGTSSAAPGWAWVGERGPELMRFRGGEQVIPNQFLRGSGGGDVHVHLHNDGVIGSKAELENWLNHGIDSLARQGRLTYALRRSPSAA